MNPLHAGSHDGTRPAKLITSTRQKTNDADENHRPHRLDTRLEVPGVSLGILVSAHTDVMAAFAANDAFQKAEASDLHIRTKIVTLKDRLDVGQRTWPKANESVPIRIRRRDHPERKANLNATLRPDPR